jgi:hypothetical protein
MAVQSRVAAVTGANKGIGLAIGTCLQSRLLPLQLPDASTRSFLVTGAGSS